MRKLDFSKMGVMILGVVGSLLVLGQIAYADFTFGTPTNLGPTINGPDSVWGVSISSDGLSLYFDSTRSGGSGEHDLWMSMRESKDDDWSPPVNLGPTINSEHQEVWPGISPDGLELFFCSTPYHGTQRPGGQGMGDIWVSTRATKDSAWSPPANLGPVVNSLADDIGPFISADGLALYFGSGRSGGRGDADLWVTIRAGKDQPWGPPVNLGSIVNTYACECWPRLSANGLCLFFASTPCYAILRPGGVGEGDLWVTTRRSKADPWGPAVNLGPSVNSVYEDGAPWLSPEESALYFTSGRPGGFGGYDIWQAPIVPIVDFNGDEIVDIDDLLILIDNWGTDESLYDIGPMPWGDGIVDREDIEVLMSYWQQEFLPIELVAYWKLDEIEGTIAYDSAGEHDGTLYGDPLWQPTGGQVTGALELDGIDDYIGTPFVLNPRVDFSVFSWIKGGAPGQVIISQENGVNWLLADTEAGALRTDISDPIKKTRLGSEGGLPLISSTVITDGNWHRIGFVWDGSYRILYVDDVEVAKDTQGNLEVSTRGLYIGAGKALEAGSFWSGLIDDVRIYNRTVTP